MEFNAEGSLHGHGRDQLRFSMGRVLVFPSGDPQGVREGALPLEQGFFINLWPRDVKQGHDAPDGLLLLDPLQFVPERRGVIADIVFEQLALPVLHFLPQLGLQLAHHVLVVELGRLWRAILASGRVNHWSSLLVVFGEG